MFVCAQQCVHRALMYFEYVVPFPPLVSDQAFCYRNTEINVTDLKQLE